MKKKILILILLLFSFSFMNFTHVKAETISCMERDEKKCKSPNYGYACVWNETKFGNYCNVDNLMYVSCGDASDIPYQVPGLISLGVNLLKIATPIILIIVSIISLVKALSSSNDDEIKKAQKSFIRRLITAAFVFFIITIVQFVMMKVADGNEKTNLSDCLACFLNNSCEENVYYKTVVGSQNLCTKLSNGQRQECDKFHISTTNNVETDYYKGERIQNKCTEEYGYFSNQYQPKAILVGNTCYKLVDTNKNINVVSYNLNGEKVPNEQTLWKTNEDGKCHYWYGKENRYVEIDCDKNLVTPQHSGIKDESCSDKGYFSNGYQPKYVSDADTCYELKEYKDKVYINGNSKQNVWYIDNYRNCYYWKGSINAYIKIDCNNVYTEYNQGPKQQNECTIKYGYHSNGYQPKYLYEAGSCYKLTDTGESYTFNSTNLLGESKIITQTKWKSENGKCYYWEGRSNQYQEIPCE